MSFAMDRARLDRLRRRGAFFRDRDGSPAGGYASLPATSDADSSLRLSGRDQWKGVVIAAGDW
jgi:hypothetical protein